MEKWVGKLEGIPRSTRKVVGCNHFHWFAIESGLEILSTLGAASTDQQELLKSVSEKLQTRPRLQ